MAKQEKWEFQDSDERITIVGGKNRGYICSVQIKQTGGGAIAAAMEDTRKANARRICHTHNNFDALLEALKNIRNYEVAGHVIRGDKTAPKSHICWTAEQAIAQAEDKE